MKKLLFVFLFVFSFVLLGFNQNKPELNPNVIGHYTNEFLNIYLDLNNDSIIIGRIDDKSVISETENLRLKNNETIFYLENGKEISIKFILADDGTLFMFIFIDEILNFSLIKNEKIKNNTLNNSNEEDEEIKRA